MHKLRQTVRSKDRFRLLYLSNLHQTLVSHRRIYERTRKDQKDHKLDVIIDNGSIQLNTKPTPKNNNIIGVSNCTITLINAERKPVSRAPFGSVRRHICIYVSGVMWEG